MEKSAYLAIDKLKSHAMHKHDQLNRYANEKNQLDTEKYGLLIYYQVKDRPFFNRFSKEVLIKYLNGAEVEYYKENEIMFMKGRVGIITHGSVVLKSHQEQIMNPTSLGRFKVGQVLGHGQSDGQISTNSHTWFTSFEKTEMVFFKFEVFQRLWDIQNKNTQYRILISCL